MTVAPQVNTKPFAAIASMAAVEEPAGRVTRSRSEVDTMNAHVSSYGADASKGNMLALNPSLDSKLQKIFACSKHQYPNACLVVVAKKAQ